MKLFVLLVVVLLFVIWKKYQKRLSEQDSQDAQSPAGESPASRPPTPARPSAAPARELLPCRVCGVHADKASLSLSAGGRYVCVLHREDSPS